ncbi:hypothetical protein [Halopseudomonas pertucinogena]|uniref:Uncharacterized protein n=1 Tax=Halopseudomonas pertucinogena TaxID=86175 RepID=A0ABQ2CRL0_9GAMM|nr:hypothetical protein [Halopseudomonas pertucinogena]GGJ06170.1 hypothetical protein GCM10009083_23930 [Halopseudomonas pertucinogena]
MNNHIAEASKKVGRPQIREIFLRNGARIEPDRDDLPDWIYEAAFELLELAAPAVQGEPVAGRPLHPSQVRTLRRNVKRNCPPEIYALLDQAIAAPQPAEQQAPADYSLTPVPDELFAAEFRAWWEQHGQFCRAGGGDYERTFAFEAWRHLYPKLMKLQKVAAEQQPAPDVAGLVEDAGPLPFWKPCNPGCDPELNGSRSRLCADLCEAAREALAAHRNQGGGV